jgi:hypothetical protein
MKFDGELNGLSKIPGKLWNDEGFGDTMSQKEILEVVFRSIRGERLCSRRSRLRPINLKEAREFIDRNHRHHEGPSGWKYGIALEDDLSVIGVVVCGRPVSRHNDDGETIEVTRCCVLGGEMRNAVSTLYGAACRAAKAMGYKRAITYTLDSEEGSSCLAAGFKQDGTTKGRSWNNKSRSRVDKAPLCDKKRWTKEL